MSVEMLNRAVTEDDPATLHVTLRNLAQRVREFQTSFGAVFSGYVSSADEGSKLILRCDCPGIESSDKVARDCWRWNHDHVGMPSSVWTEELDPGEQVSEAFTVFGHPNNSGPCLPPGTFRFENGYNIRVDGERRAGFSWGFSLSVDEG